ncbi:unnamed protein product [marine sediment metagenome]|uniref:Uncharacterized protein n=1 Tax=marine sediment metagenome TaxID=412755 RepID=X1DHC9_9ZZZZ
MYVFKVGKLSSFYCKANLKPTKELHVEFKINNRFFELFLEKK